MALKLSLLIWLMWLKLWEDQPLIQQSTLAANWEPRPNLILRTSVLSSMVRTTLANYRICSTFSFENLYCVLNVIIQRRIC
uniref:Putative secreted protein n=1 Tax=Xenopsylla cheopis TaxID=163159 RepID=A0A6M2DYR1_XENCH